jgi:hypothetical protein
MRFSFSLSTNCDPGPGEFEERRLEHANDEVRSFYAGLAAPALVGIEATGYTLWFAELMSELGCNAPRSFGPIFSR